MPSGSRKRKAAKKKKGLESHAPNNNLPQINENDDLKQHDSKESEGEDDLANPQHQLTDEEEKGDVQLSGVENRSTVETEKNGVSVEEGVLGDMVAHNDPLEIDVEFNDSIVEHVGSEKESVTGVLSHTGNEDGVVLSGSVNETKSNEELNKIAAVQNIEHEKDSGEGGLLQVDAGESYVIDAPNTAVDDAPFASYTEASSLLSEVPSLVPNPVPAEENFGSVLQSGPVEKISIDSSSQGSFVPAEQGNDEKLKKEAEALDQENASVLIHKDWGLGNKNDEVGVSSAKSSIIQETKEMLLTDITGSDEAANHANASNGSDYSKRIEAHESFVNQPLLGSAAQPVQKTSWLSCCGLLDVLAGSNR